MKLSPRSKPTIKAQLEPGHVFQPIDEELLVDYLLMWICLERVPCDIVILDDVYRTEPWKLLAEYQLEDEGYFLTRIKGNHNRTAGSGSYIIQTRQVSDLIANLRIPWSKSTFTYRCKEVGEKNRKRKRKRNSSGWVMHEYKIAQENEWVLCRVKLSDDPQILRRKKCKQTAIVIADQGDEQQMGVLPVEAGKELMVADQVDDDNFDVLEIEQQQWDF